MFPVGDKIMTFTYQSDVLSTDLQGNWQTGASQVISSSKRSQYCQWPIRLPYLDHMSKIDQSEGCFFFLFHSSAFLGTPKDQAEFSGLVQWSLVRFSLVDYHYCTVYLITFKCNRAAFISRDIESIAPFCLVLEGEEVLVGINFKVNIFK